MISDKVDRTDAALGIGAFAGGVTATLIGNIWLVYDSKSMIGWVMFFVGVAVSLFGLGLIFYFVFEQRRLLPTAKMRFVDDEALDRSVALSESTLPRLRFGLPMMFFLMTAVAAAFAVLFATPPEHFLRRLVMAQNVLSGGLIAVVVYDRGIARAFCIPALVPAAWMFVRTFGVAKGFNIRSARVRGGVETIRMEAIENWSMIVVAGAIGVAVFICFKPRPVMEASRKSKPRANPEVQDASFPVHQSQRTCMPPR